MSSWQALDEDGFGCGTIELSCDQESPFFLIDNREEIRQIGKCRAACLERRGLFANIVHIQDVCVAAVGCTAEEYCERNDTLKLLSSQDGFWVTDETEFKIETDEGDAILSAVACKSVDGFTFSHVNSFSNFERYIKFTCGDQTEYIDVLGKRGWSAQMGMKHKREIEAPILTRRVHILPFSEDGMVGYVQSLFGRPYNQIERTSLRAYYKKKLRLICLDASTGDVYGVSYSVSTPLSKRLSPLKEIEIEFWSRVVPKRLCHVPNDSDFDPDSYNRLIGCIEGHISGPFSAPGRTKVQWLEDM